MVSKTEKSLLCFAVCCPAGESFGLKGRAISVRDSRPENESSQVGVSLRDYIKKGLTPYSMADSDPTAVCTQQMSTIDHRHLRRQCRDVSWSHRKPLEYTCSLVSLVDLLFHSNKTGVSNHWTRIWNYGMMERNDGMENGMD